MPTYDYRISNGSSQVAGAGTVTVSLGSANVTGSGTSFTVQAHTGDLLLSGGQVVGSVLTVTSNTALILNLPSPVALAATTYVIDPLVNTETLTPAFPFAPKGVPKSWAQPFDLGDGTKRGLGLPSTVWRFGFVTQAFRDALRVYAGSGAAANVWIRTMTLENANTFQTCAAAMLWPDEEPMDAHRRVPFEVTFRAVVIL